MFYKLISGQNIVGVATHDDFLKFQTKNAILLTCSARTAQYIMSDGVLYHADWMIPITTQRYPYTMAEVIEIDEEEYEALYEAIHSGEDVPVVPDPPEPEEPEEPDEDEITVPFLREKTIERMSAICNQVITDGLDIILSDGVRHHFSLTDEDQFELYVLSQSAKAGGTYLPYHADDEACIFFTPEDIISVAETAQAYKTYHKTYFNSLKMYINSLRSIHTLANVTYGMEIPERYQSEVYRDLTDEEKLI